MSETGNEGPVPGLRELELRLSQRTAELEAAKSDLETIHACISHDVRAPLRHITGFARILEEVAGGTLDAEGRRSLQKIREAAARMEGLIQDLLEFSRAARAPIGCAEVDLERVLDEAIASLQSELRDRRVEWQRTGLPGVLADAGTMRQVFIHLLSNAIKFSRPRPLTRIEIGWREERAGEITVYVRDNGVGFDSQQAEHLFSPFRRQHSADEFEGNGIGLANAHRMVTRQGGRMWAESAVDAGATLYFTLPRSSAPSGGAPR